MFLHRDPTQYFYAMVAIFLVLPVHEQHIYWEIIQLDFKEE